MSSIFIYLLLTLLRGWESPHFSSRLEPHGSPRFIIYYYSLFPFPVDASALRNDESCVKLDKFQACRLSASSCNTASYEYDWGGGHTRLAMNGTRGPTANTAVKAVELMATAKPSTGRTRRQVVDEDPGGFHAMYLGTVTTKQRQALDYCMEEASFWWPSPVRVDVVIGLSSMPDESILGSAQPLSMWTVNGTFYPVALLEAIANESIDVGASNPGDIYMRLNADLSWYTELSLTDSPSSNEYDLVTVCLHELIHGLFMTGGNIKVERNDSLVEDEATTTNGYLATLCDGEYMGRFDGFLANDDGCAIVPAYRDNPAWFGDALTNNELWFANHAGEKIAKLHASRPYIEGTSIYHLYQAEHLDDLMTPTLGKGYRRHEISPIITDIMKVMLDESQPHAKVCENVSPPIKELPSFVDGGGTANNNDEDSDGNGDGGNETGEDGDDNVPSDSNNNFESQPQGFVVTIGTLVISGWLIVGSVIGFVILVVVAALLIRFIIIRATDAKNRPPPRRVAKTDTNLPNHNSAVV